MKDRNSVLGTQGFAFESQINTQPPKHLTTKFDGVNSVLKSTSSVRTLGMSIR